MATPNIRLFPPSTGTRPSIVVNGRTYTCALNSTVDAPIQDAQVMMANGWVKAADGVGPTSARPTAVGLGYLYHDTTLNLTIAYEGATWRNPTTGGIV